MTSGDEIGKVLCRTFIKIAEREKRKAIKNDDYGGALIVSIFEGFAKEAQKSIQ